MSVGKYRPYCIGLFVMVLLVMLSNNTDATPQAANFFGTWQMSMDSSSSRGGGGGSGGRQGSGDEAQTLTITQVGDKFKITHKTPRSEEVFDATVSDNTISWTETRQGRDRNSMSIEYKAIVDGDEMKGRMRGGQFSRQFTAKRLS